MATSKEKIYEQALQNVMDLYHERHLLTPDERKLLPFTMKEAALKGLYSANQVKLKPTEFVDNLSSLVIY